MANQSSGKLTVKHIVGYCCGDWGGSMTLYMMAGYMSRYLQVFLQVNPAILATMLLVWNIWDAVNDPLMGTLMDIFFAKAKPGADKFRPWILASIPIMGIGLISFYWVPGVMGGGVAMLAAAFILKIIYEGGYTMMNIGMGSLLGNMAKDDTERATLASARGFGATFAQLLAGFMIPQLLAYFGESIEGYRWTAIILTLSALAIVFLHYALTEERNKKDPALEAAKTEEEKAAEKFKITDIGNIVTKNRAFLALVLHSICICAVQALGQGAAVYMYADVLGDIGMQGYASTMSSVLIICILVVAPILTRKWDLVNIIRVCLMGGFISLGALLAYTLMVDELNAWLFVVWNAIGNGLITMSVQMQWGLVAETIDYNEYLTGKRNEGTIYGFFSLSRRVGSTIANSVTVLLIAAIGYDAALTTAGLMQADSTIAGIKMMFVGFPVVAALGSWTCFTFIWNINKDVRAKMAAWKKEKADEEAKRLEALK